MSLKEQKEAFVTGHEGTTVIELLLVCLSAPIGVWLLSKLTLPSNTHKIAAEALVVLFPMMLVQTNLLYPWGVVLLTIESVFATWLQLAQTTKQLDNPTSVPDASSQSRRLVSFTCFRAAVMYFTFVAILAVDFPVFPRHFCKTEVMGYGLMDLGAGSFVVAAGLLPHQQMKQSWNRILPLVILGLIRFTANKGLDYQEHMSEYGIHWNFFLTLAVVTPLASFCISSLPTLWSSWLVPLAIMSCYQYTLSTGLQEYIESAPRTCTASAMPLCDLFAANREGILGCLGYLSIYLASCGIGRSCLWNNVDNARRRQTLLYGSAIVLWTIHFLLASAAIPVSRRSTNATFCVWTLAHNILLLALLDTATASSTSPPIVLNALNRHGLFVFVVANLLTGLVNLTLDTLYASDETALAILILYLGAVCGFAMLLDPVLVLLLGTNNKIVKVQ